MNVYIYIYTCTIIVYIYIYICIHRVAECPVVHERAQEHHELAVEAVHHAPVPRDEVVKVLDNSNAYTNNGNGNSNSDSNSISSNTHDSNSNNKH